MKQDGKPILERKKSGRYCSVEPTEHLSGVWSDQCTTSAWSNPEWTPSIFYRGFKGSYHQPQNSPAEKETPRLKRPNLESLTFGLGKKNFGWAVFRMSPRYSKWWRGSCMDFWRFRNQRKHARSGQFKLHCESEPVSIAPSKGDFPDIPQLGCPENSARPAWGPEPWCTPSASWKNGMARPQTENVESPVQS